MVDQCKYDSWRTMADPELLEGPAPTSKLEIAKKIGDIVNLKSGCWTLPTENGIFTGLILQKLAVLSTGLRGYQLFEMWISGYLTLGCRAQS